MRILTSIAFLVFMSANLTAQTGMKLVYQTRYEPQDPKFRGPGRNGEQTVNYRLADRMRSEVSHSDGLGFVTIVRCDLGRMYVLDLRNRQYSEAPLRSPEEIARDENSDTNAHSPKANRITSSRLILSTPARRSRPSDTPRGTT